MKQFSGKPAVWERGEGPHASANDACVEPPSRKAHSRRQPPADGATGAPARGYWLTEARGSHSAKVPPVPGFTCPTEVIRIAYEVVVCT